MRIAYLDCFAGISGDMFLGALLDAGVPAEVLQDATKALRVGASLKIERVDRSGISCTKADVLEDGQLAEGKTQSSTHSHPHGIRGQENAAAPVSVEHQSSTERTAHMHQPKAQHLHKAEHAHSHDEDVDRAAHAHGRSLTQILALIKESPLEEAVKKTAVRAFELLGQSEAKIHHVPVDEIHFHEVGGVDAIVDIVAASAGIHHLGIDAWHCSPVNVGGGVVECAHGTFPVPAPATADLLRGFPTYSAHVQKELVTPTGAALLRVIEPTFGPQPAMQVERIGYGAGTRNPKDFPNVLRLQIGESFEVAKFSQRTQARWPEQLGAHETAGVTSHATEPTTADESKKQHGPHDSTTVAVLETALDDLSPQILAYVAETALARGALDVMLTPVVMKKGRPGTLLTILCNPSEAGEMERLMLCETSTLGVRIRQDRRSCLDRRHTAVQTEYGEIRMKIGMLDGEEINAAPEFEDCRAAAARCRAPLKVVQQAAIGAYRTLNSPSS